MHLRCQRKHKLQVYLEKAAKGCGKDNITYPFLHLETTLNDAIRNS